MRIFTMAVSFILAVVLYTFSDDAGLVGTLADNDDMGAIAGAGLIGALLWVLGGALVYSLPIVSMVIFLLSFAEMALIEVATEPQTDLVVYMWGGLLLAGSSFFAWRGKRKEDDAKAEERRKQDERDAMMMRMMNQRTGN